ncbi:hypothetical protein MBLNU459_g8344t1 [Dothideomycetes sp. NU459]
MNGDSSQTSQNGLKSFYGYKETFGKDSVWVDIPRELTFVHTSNPYDDTNSPVNSGHLERANTSLGHDTHAYLPAWSPPPGASQFLLDAQSSTHGLEALSAVASGDHYLHAPIQSVALESSPHDLNFILELSGASAAISPPIDPQLGASTSEFSHIASLQQDGSTISQLSNVSPESDDDVPFLLRYFSEGPGEWMDLFDLGSFFATDVPVKAASCPLLLYAAIALSAKALGRIRISAQHAKQPVSKRTPSQWLHKARYYYDLAIGLLRQALENETRPRSSDVQVPRVSESFSHSPEPMRNTTPGLPRTASDELVATTAILCVYEFLDASGLEWSRHLDGARSLFDIATDGTMPLSVQSPMQSTSIVRQPSTSTKGRRAVFWNVCRQEMLNAFINNKSTRLDTADLGLWRSAGLHISATGYIVPSNDPTRHEPMTEDMIANALVWLTMKLVNFIAAGDEFPHELGLGIRQQQLLEYWEGLERQLDVWAEGLPDSFKPSATVWPDKNKARKIGGGSSSGSGSDTSNTYDDNEASNPLAHPKKWFARPMCASTMQSFHFARIQLLHNKPHLSTGGAAHPSSSNNNDDQSVTAAASASSLAQRHASYAAILQQSRNHANEIVSIALALTNDAARLHSVQPLYTAGQVLGFGAGAWDRRRVEAVRGCILNLLQEIQRETGWATEYRMQQLLEQWGLPSAHYSGA